MRKHVFTDFAAQLWAMNGLLLWNRFVKPLLSLPDLVSKWLGGICCYVACIALCLFLSPETIINLTQICLEGPTEDVSRC
jgi:hypothetical protein